VRKADQPTLYVVPGSHPSMAGRLMLAHKGIAYRRVDLIAALHKPILRALGFKDTTVPALRIDGRRLQSTLRISRALEELRPDPPLFPSDGPQRRAVEEAERWGEEELQPIPRRLSWWALRRSRPAVRSFAEGSRLGVPIGLAARTAGPIIWAEVRINGATDAAIQADLAALPAMLDRVDAWLEDGVLGRQPPNAADYQIATSIRLLLLFEDLREAIERRPVASYARTLVSEFPGAVPKVLPDAWTAALR
jgi:glutathione S-transferase